jgi:hypothetical protein
MTMKLRDISGDSTVTCVSYADGVAEIHLIDGETDDLLRVPTPVFYSEASSANGCAFIQLLPLAEHSRACSGVSDALGSKKPHHRKSANTETCPITPSPKKTARSSEWTTCSSLSKTLRR